MSTATRSNKIIVVTGDVTMDWNLTSSRLDQKRKKDGYVSTKTYTSWQRGGAALLADLIEKVAYGLPQSMDRWEVRQTDAPSKTICPNDPHYNHSFALWMEMNKEKKSKPGEKVWRVDTFLGLHQAITESQKWMEVVGDTPDAGLVILDDADLYFRKFDGLWPVALKTPDQSPWVLLKTSGRVVDGYLWRYLLNNHAERLIVLMRAEDLRRVRVENDSDEGNQPENNEVQISRELSWESAVEDLIWEINHNPTLKDLLRCVHIIVTFGTGGAILISRDLTTPGKSLLSTNTLIFDSNEIENSWETHYPGYMMAGTNCLTASLAREIMLDPAHPNLEDGIKSGLNAMRRLQEVGYQQIEIPGCGKQIQFPFDEIVKALSYNQTKFGSVIVNPPTIIGSTAAVPSGKEAFQIPYWTILGEINQDDVSHQNNHPGQNLERKHKNIFMLSQGAVLKGIETALGNVPVGRFRNLITVDRREIESFRSILTLISEYIEKENPGRPLSIAVFGAPGSGKSFGIKQVANSISDQIEEKTFNLSQFTSEENLKDALHQVRDVALSGKIPLIFWDEFDTSFQHMPLGWLRFFLAPMQDGNFQDGQITHPIGRCIFIFAGGTCATMEEFKDWDPDKKKRKDQKRGDFQSFTEVKGPDFVSRLKGFINIMGPNPVGKEGETFEEARNRDPYYQIRRAVLIRSLFERKYQNLFKNGQLQIDQGLLRALLEVPKYIHGARSIESIIEMSALNEKEYFDRSSLPVPVLLNLHVDADQFVETMQMKEIKDKDLIKRMAKAVHEAFCHQRREEGYRYGPDYSETEKKHPALLDYDDPKLDDVFRVEGNNIAKDIIKKLDRLGYKVRQARSVFMQYQFSQDEIEQMAHWEQIRWMIGKLTDGWKWAPVTDPKKKENNCILFWEEASMDQITADFSSGFNRGQMDEMIKSDVIGRGPLPESEKEIYRMMVREIPVFLAKAGCTVQKKVE